MQTRLFRFIISVLVGLAAGLVYGWVISPVEYVDTTPDTLREDFRTDYVLMTAEIYAGDRDIERAARNLASLGSANPSITAMQALEFARRNSFSGSDIQLLEELATQLQTWQAQAEAQRP